MDDDITLPCTSCSRYTCRCAEYARSAAEPSARRDPACWGEVPSMSWSAAVSMNA